jgi:hypothetical protein
MSNEKPVSWADITTLMRAHNKPLDQLATITPAQDEGEASASPRQIIAASPKDTEEMREMAERAAKVFDEIEDLYRPIAGLIAAKEKELKVLKEELVDRMLSHGTKNIKIQDRPPLELVTKKDKQKTMKEFIRILGPDEGKKLWNSLTMDEHHSLKIPQATPPDA